MFRYTAKVAALAFLALLGVKPALAGNPDRVGQAGGTELLINPWAQPAGWGGANTAGITGVSAMSFNVAGLVGAPGTQFAFSTTSWLTGSDIFVNSLGFTSPLGEASAIGFNLVAFDFGDIEVTTANSPEGTGRTYSPQYFNISTSFARKFSNSIRGGVLLRFITEATTGVRASGIALDAGIQYVTGPYDNFRFGVSLMNVGTPMSFDGDALSLRGQIENSDQSRTLRSLSAQTELPSALNIGVTYSFLFDNDSVNAVSVKHKLTPAATFTSNAFSSDVVTGGLEYTFRGIVAVRAGYSQLINLPADEVRGWTFTGPSAGASLTLPFGEDGEKSLSVDYAYRDTRTFGGNHSFGLRLGF